MQKISFGIMVILILLFSATYAPAQVSIGIGLPNVSIGINLPLFPELVPVPGYPVYYAPRVAGNYFFYDGMYWVFWNGNWYASTWYNGPWYYVDPYDVPLFILRIPVRYYRRPPAFFRGWRSTAPPRWGEHWGRSWEQRHRGWDKWNHGSSPKRAPLPSYQRHYSRDRYPNAEQQRAIRSRDYRYQPHNTMIRKHFNQGGAPGQARPERREAPRKTSPQQNEFRQTAPPRQGAPAGVRPQQPHGCGMEYKRPSQPHPQPPRREAQPTMKPEPHNRQQPQQQRQGTPAPREQRQHPGAEQQRREQPGYQGGQQRSPGPEHGQGQGREKGEERGRGPN